ncbi:hypothetical protein, partial [Agromyces humi]|uniref:hypothetical protein n=1 Tax=Agromyces humi TaxID=1766800 RepID=UPI00193A93CC
QGAHVRVGGDGQLERGLQHAERGDERFEHVVSSRSTGVAADASTAGRMRGERRGAVDPAAARWSRVAPDTQAGG